MKSLTELQTKIHQGNVERGFWETNILKQKLVLIMTEVVEAFEEVRTGRPPAWVKNDGICTIETLDWNSFVMNNNGDISFLKPEGELFELADVVIRCLDLAGFHNLDLSDRQQGRYAYDVNEFYFALMRELTNEENGLWFILQKTVSTIEWYCKDKEWDLWGAVDIKVRFNETRPFKHGKKF
jgi:hypothetical protein